MSKTKNKKAFTLLEVIVSLAIFSIISVGFYSLFASVFINTYKTSKVTEQAFLEQRELEDKIANLKVDIKSEAEIDDVSITEAVITLFNDDPDSKRVVKGYIVNNESGNVLNLESFVANFNPPRLQVPELKPFNIAAYQDSPTAVDLPNIGMNKLRLDLTKSLSVDNPGLLVSYVYNWYMSSDISYTPFEAPTFPDNYAIIPGKIESQLSNLKEEYGGRFFSLFITPVGEKGQMGEMLTSDDEIYVSQFKVNDNLLLRLDASYFDMGSTVNVNKEEIGNATTYYAKYWEAVIPAKLKNNTAVVQSKQPVIERKNLENDGKSHLVFTLTGKDSNLREIKSGSHSSINSKANATIYISLKIGSGITDTIRILDGSTSNNKWYLNFENDSLILSRRLYKASGWFGGGYDHTRTALVGLEPEVLASDDMMIVKLEIYNDQLAIEFNGQRGDDSADTRSYSTYDSSSNFDSVPLTIQVSDKIKIGDVLIYEGKHTPEITAEVYDYFIKKYMLD